LRGSSTSNDRWARLRIFDDKEVKLDFVVSAILLPVQYQQVTVPLACKGGGTVGIT
jgi:hypothetical protein